VGGGSFHRLWLRWQWKVPRWRWHSVVA